MRRMDALWLMLAGVLCAAVAISSLSACGGGGSDNPAAPVVSTPEPSFPSSLTLTQVATGLDNPVAVVNAGDGSDRLFVVEKEGVIKIVRNGVVSATPFLDITGLVNSAGSEQGLLGLAFSPDFATNRSFYVNYTNNTGVGNTVVARYTAGSNPELADPASGTEILSIVQPFTNHNGGQLAFGPDGFLYIGTGDGGGEGDPQGNGQKTTTLLGKILRIDVSGPAPYAIPAGNHSEEIWALGLRNPWRFSFDRSTGDFYLADVGQAQVEEIDFQSAATGAGANYGWNLMEGSRCFDNPGCSSTGLTLPVAEYLHADGNCSVTGGHVYRGANQDLQGIYLYGDFCSGRIWGLRKNGASWANQLLTDTTFSISTFGQDEAGEVYLADYTAGNLYRIGVP